MAEKVYGLTKSAAGRTAAVVRKVEGIPTRAVGGQLPPHVPPLRTFWIQLTAAGSTSGFYDWKMVYYNPATSAWVDASPSVTGTNTAREGNLTTGLYSASSPKRYLAQYFGINGSNLPVYVFSGSFALPAATGKGKVLQLIDDANPGTWGVDYPRFANVI